MANCTSCGSPIVEGQTFCGKCGQPVGAGAVAPAAPPAPPTPPQAMAAPVVPLQPQYQAPPPPYGQPPYGQPAYGPGPGYPPGAWQQPRKSKKGLWIGIAAAVVVVAVAAVLIFAVFWGQISGGGGPEQTVQKLLNAYEDKDSKAFVSLMAPGSLDKLAGTTGSPMTDQEAATMLEQNVFTYESLKFEDVKMKTEMTGDNAATVTITAGSVIHKDTADAEAVTEDVTASDTPVVFSLVKQDGKWYVDASSFN